MGLLRLTNKRPDADIDEAIRATIADANTLWEPLQFEGEFPLNGFGIANLRPYHVQNTTTNLPQTSNRNYWETCQVISSAYSTWINLTVDEDSYLIITGYFSLEQQAAVTEIKFSANGVDLPPINVEEMHSWDLARGFFTKPFVVKPKSNFTVKVYGDPDRNINQTTKRIGLLGYCVGKRAFLIKETL